ncbi:Assimilatory nitrite reductase [NAD(P)H] small subunit [Caballeronia calidae]|uniref:Assimilatory nitrite reductase [NAD(P)H] small subunit n=1 Tax=Caballeronia calidae TaxID=1777139 RepID=A0A158BZI2_9BURK|nr:Rieske 2Fe-2S domain-containing protein [Caballeronia calidae]SAK75519.1 Assimilatory nitrite reductase [NAD(P)H] small subunit [Caballeronia calidae]
MTDQAQPSSAPNLVPVALATELSPGQRKLVFAKGKSVVMFNVAGTIHAIENSWPNNGASLASGCIDGTVLRCPAHGLKFDLAEPDEGRAGCACTRFPCARWEVCDLADRSWRPLAHAANGPVMRQCSARPPRTTPGTIEAGRPVAGT